MTETLTKHEKNLSAAIHASTFSRFFIPFGNFILPLVLWIANRKDLKFVDYNGKQVLNFQISLFLYSVVLGAISIPFFFSLVPDLFDGGILNWHGMHDFFDLDFRFNHDHWNFTRFIWPIGIAGIIHVVLFVVNIVFTILGTIRTSEGEYFTYPLTIKFIR